MLHRQFSKFSAALIVFAAASVLFVTTALADSDKMTNDVNECDNYVGEQIEHAIMDSDHAMNECMKQINEEYDKFDKHPDIQNEFKKNVAKHQADFEAKLDKISQELMSKTNGRVGALLRKYQKCGDMIVASYIEVKLADRTYWVDPLRIVGH